MNSPHDLVDIRARGFDDVRQPLVAEQLAVERSRFRQTVREEKQRLALFQRHINSLVLEPAAKAERETRTFRYDGFERSAAEQIRVGKAGVDEGDAGCGRVVSRQYER